MNNIDKEYLSIRYHLFPGYIDLLLHFDEKFRNKTINQEDLEKFLNNEIDNSTLRDETTKQEYYEFDEENKILYWITKTGYFDYNPVDKTYWWKYKIKKEKLDNKIHNYPSKNYIIEGKMETTYRHYLNEDLDYSDDDIDIVLKENPGKIKKKKIRKKTSRTLLLNIPFSLSLNKLFSYF